jgi:outer membrane receptor protein involved in Fe transport
VAHGGDVAIARLVVRNASFRRHDRRQRPAPRRCQYQHWAPYAQVNVGVAREFLLPDDPKPMTLRFDVVNLFDTIYQLRDGSGIGVFAPQFGPRRGYFAGTSKKF